MKHKISYAIAGLMLSALPLAAATDCLEISESVKAAITNDSTVTLSIVAEKVENSPACSCEIVKSAIQASHADADLVAKIVESAILAAPDQMRMISQCAIAIAPDALPQIQGVLAKHDPHAGGSYSSKAPQAVGKSPSKDAGPIDRQASVSNPLDFPGIGPIGPRDGITDGGVPGGGSSVPGGDVMIGPVFPPSIITSPVPPVEETPVNPVDDDRKLDTPSH